jgi:hypothetical protein
MLRFFRWLFPHKPTTIISMFPTVGTRVKLSESYIRLYGECAAKHRFADRRGIIVEVGRCGVLVKWVEVEHWEGVYTWSEITPA